MAKRYSEKIPFSTISIHENMKKKFLKIMPIFIITNIVTLILQWFNILTTGNSYIVGNNTLSALFLSFCGIQYLGLGLNTPGWFLTVLFLCYFIFYIYLKKAKTKVHFLYFVFFTMCLGVVFLVNPLDFILLRKDIARGLFSFFLGVLSFFGVEKYVEKSKKTGIICLSISSIILWLFSLYYNLGGEIHISFTFFVAIPLIILVVYFKPINWLLSLKVFQYIGAVSLSIYLWNFPIDAVFDIVNRYLGIFQYNSCKFFVFHLIISLLISIGLQKLLSKILERKIF